MNEWINKYILFRQRGQRQGYEVQKIQIKKVTLNQIWLREPLEIQTIKPTNHLKWTTEFEYNGHEQLIYINYSQSSHFDILEDNSTHSYSYTYNMLSHLFISGDCGYASLLSAEWVIDNGSNNTVEEAVTLLIKL